MTERDQTILQLYHAGTKLKDIAGKVGMAPNSIGQVLKRLGVERPSKPQKRWLGRDDQSENIIKLWQQGLCVTQIAERLQEGRMTVEHVLTKAGIRNSENPRHRYDGIGGGIGRGRGGGDRSGAFARIARRA